MTILEKNKTCSSTVTETHVTAADHFATYVLRSQELEVSVVPALGAKITTLRNLRSRREWLWSAPDGRGLRKSRPGDAFETGSMAGIDECVPTIAPCRLGDQCLPDHGEAWARAWTVCQSAWAEGRLRTTLDLACLPLRIERELTLEANVLTLRYQLSNLSDVLQPGFWAFHPLFARHEGDHIDLAPRVCAVKVDSQLGLGLNAGAIVSWPCPHPGLNLSTFTSADGGDWYAKLFVDGTYSGGATIANAHTGDRLEISFESDRAMHLGIWITRGGWNGFDHFALEPTAHAGETPAADDPFGQLLPPYTTRTWQVRLSCAVNEKNLPL